jgi:uncharacterized protein YjbI with pentapeptide repeats
MANEEHLAQLKQGVSTWNEWRKKNPEIRPDLIGANPPEANLAGANLAGAYLTQANLEETNLSHANLAGAYLTQANLAEANLAQAKLAGVNLSGADLSRTYLLRAFLPDAKLAGVNLAGAYLAEANLTRTNLSGINLSGINLSMANLEETNLSHANLTGANLARVNLYGASLAEINLSGAKLAGADLSYARLTGGADLTRADLTGATLIRTDLTGADLTGASLETAQLVDTTLRGATLTGCRVYGISAWNLKLEGAKQANLIITRNDEPVITVDNLEVAQFIYLLLNNQRIREVIDTITSKVVLILGRFTPERKAVLDRLRDDLRTRDYLPIVFDFDKPTSKDLTGTVTTLANMARFIIADLTNPSSVPHELAMIVPGTVVPVQAILLEGQAEYAMFIDLKKRYHWVLEPYQYSSSELLIAHLKEQVIDPAEAKARELR